MSTPVARRAEYQARHQGNQSGSQTATGAEGSTVLKHKGLEEAGRLGTDGLYLLG
jgi:hypothetical protein